MDPETWHQMYSESINDKEEFFSKMATKMLTWDRPFTKTYSGCFAQGENRWFEDGKLNACYNCVDRHLVGDYSKEYKPAIIYQAEDGLTEIYTYRKLLQEVCAVANILKEYVSAGECVTIYMPMCPEAAFAILACARLGVVHNVVFGGFSAESLRLRLLDSRAKVVVTMGEVSRAGKKIDFLKIVKEAVGSEKVKIVVMDETEEEGVIEVCRNKNYSFVPCVPVEAEHRLFYLYTSGSTGKPKGVYHSTGGYLLYAMMTTKFCFDIQSEDKFLCTADFGWITGHTYTLYGPLLNGITTILLGGAPMAPPTRVFHTIEQLGATQFYTAPTLIRMLMQATAGMELGYKLESLRCIGSVGEPLNKDAYLWYSRVFGMDRLPLIDTYWQTEAGGVMLSPIPKVMSGVPECAGLPFFGMKPVIVDSLGQPTTGLGKLVFEGAWPGMARGIINDQERFVSSYFKTMPGFYFTGDEGYSKDGLFWVQGRVDDVINVSAHRLSTAEIESAVCSSGLVMEAAVVAVPDKLTGQAIVLFMVANADDDSVLSGVNSELEKDIRLHLRKVIGPIINPKAMFFVRELPKTRTGKLMRRILRCVLSGEEVGDLSTCINSGSVEDIRMIVNQVK